MNRKVIFFGVVVAGLLGGLALFGLLESAPKDESAVAPSLVNKIQSTSTVNAERVSTPTAVSSSPRSAMAGLPHKTPPAELPGGPVRSYLPDLLQRASGPNPSADAALAAFLALNACKFRQEHGPAAPAASGNAGSDLSKPSLQDCEGITEKDWADAPRLLKLAAELGSERAQIAYARKAPLDGKQLEDFFQNPEELVEFKNNANRYLLAASEAGNVDAMWFLSESLKTGDLMQRDLVAAYQYKYAISRTGAYPQQYISGDIATLEAQLTPEQIRAARDSADAFLARCCKGTGVHK